MATKQELNDRYNNLCGQLGQVVSNIEALTKQKSLLLNEISNIVEIAKHLPEASEAKSE